MSYWPKERDAWMLRAETAEARVKELDRTELDLKAALLRIKELEVDRDRWRDTARRALAAAEKP